MEMNVSNPTLFSRVGKELNTKVKGAFAFEYVIVLAIMTVVIFTAWMILGQAVMDKARDIAENLSNQKVADDDFAGK